LGFGSHSSEISRADQVHVWANDGEVAMKIEITTATFVKGDYCEAGTIIELNDREGQDLINMGRATKASIVEVDQSLSDRSIGLSDAPEFTKRKGRLPRGE
jgi:hypothetical protein